MNGDVSLDARMERLETAMHTLAERLDVEEAAKSSYEIESTENVGFQGRYPTFFSHLKTKMLN